MWQICVILKIMNNKKTILVSKFDGVKSNRSYVVVDIHKWLLSNHSQEVVNQIRKTSNEDERKTLKCKLPAITPSGIFHKRSNKGLVEPSYLICIDIDGKDNPSISDMGRLKERLSKLPYIMYCGLSASGTGLFCIIPYEDFQKHKLYFYSLEQKFRDMGIMVDSSCSDIARLRIASYDEYPYFNPDAAIYTSTLEKPSVVHSENRLQKEYNDSPKVVHGQQFEILSMEEALLRPSNMDYASATPLSKTQKVERLLKRVIEKKKDITLIYDDWIAICYIIKNLFGEEGRILFHQVSSFFPRYDYDRVDYEYSSKKRGEYLYNTDRLFEIAAKYGIY